MRPFCVGLTGGVGSGKSAVADLFAGHGVAIVDTDEIARRLTTADGRAMPAIIAAFGTKYLDSEGALNRPFMRKHVFKDSSALRCLEHIIHPLIRDEARQQLSQLVSDYVVLVVPLLAEHLADYRAMVDRIIVVDCDEQQQIERIMARPGMSEEQVKSILASQATREVRLAIADDVIDNRGDFSSLSKQVASLHNRYINTVQGICHR